MNSKKKQKALRFFSIILAICITFGAADFILSEITDTKAYKDAVRDDVKWEEVCDKSLHGQVLTQDDYDIILSQTGLGKPAFDKLASAGNYEKIEEYRDYFLTDKDYYCYRKGVFACHEEITDKDGNFIDNPPFADLQNGDIIVTLSIHSLGWRHGHAAIVTDVDSGLGVQAVMVGERSSYTYISTWEDYPLVAVLRVKDATKEEREQVALYAEDNLRGIWYSLFAGILTGRNHDRVPFTTQCAHLVWYAYSCFDMDISPNCGRIITPKDFLESEKLEIVQIYGSITEELK